MAGTVRTREQLTTAPGAPFRTGAVPVNGDFQDLSASHFNLLDDDASRVTVDPVSHVFLTTELGVLPLEAGGPRALLAGVINKIVSLLPFTVRTVDTIAELRALPGDTRRAVYVRGTDGIGAGLFGYVAARLAEDDGIGVVAGWVRQAPVQMTPQLFGARAVAGVDNRAAFEAAVSYCAAQGLTLYVPDGTYEGSALSLTQPCRLVLSDRAVLNFTLSLVGDAYTRSHTVQLSGDWAVYPPGTAVFAGDFSQFAAGDVAVVELSAGDAGLAAQNQAGVDFLVVQTASASQLVTTAGTRMPFRSPRISRLAQAARYTGSLAAGSYQIPGNYTGKFAAGDLVRVENLDGTDAVAGAKFYFEFARVKSIDASAVVFERLLQHAYVNATLVRAAALDGVTVRGGRIRELNCFHVQRVNVKQLLVERFSLNYGYDYFLSDVYASGQQTPITFGMTFAFHGSASGCRAANASGSTDNGAFKVMSCPGLSLRDIDGSDTYASAQGVYGVLVDYLYVPYAIWNTGLSADLRADMGKAGASRAIWLLGVRNGLIHAQSSSGGVCLENSMDTDMHAICPRGMFELRNLKRCHVQGHGKVLSIEGQAGCTFRATTRDSGGSNFGRGTWMRAGTADPESGAAPFANTGGVLDVVNYSTTAGDISIYLQSVTGLVLGAGCMDNSGLAASVSFGASVISVILQPSALQNAMSASPTIWQPPRGKLLKMDGGYQDGLAVMNGAYLWVDASGKLRIHSARPSADSNGVVAGTQT